MGSFEQAIEKDPGYAPAYVGLADCFNSLGVWALASPESVFPKANMLAGKALELEENLAEAHASQAVVRIFYDWDWDAAEFELKRALKLNPGYALGHLWHGHFLSIIGRLDESIEAVKRAQNLDPLSAVINANVGWTFFLARRFDETREELQKAVELDPYSGMAWLYLGMVHICEEKYATAIAEFAKAIELSGGNMPWAAEMMGCAYALAGERGEARKILRETRERSGKGYVPSSAIASIYYGLKQKDRVFEWLSTAYEERDTLLPWLKSAPSFDWLRPDPRFEDLMRRLGLSS
jgi:tetratricopeptide (TPR) repeat protein